MIEFKTEDSPNNFLDTIKKEIDNKKIKNWKYYEITDMAGNNKSICFENTNNELIKGIASLRVASINGKDSCIALDFSVSGNRDYTDDEHDLMYAELNTEFVRLLLTKLKDSLKYHEDIKITPIA